MNDDELHTDDIPHADQAALNSGLGSVPATDFDIDIDDIVVSLNEQHASLSQYIDRHWHDLDVNRLARLLALHGQNASRLGRLLRDYCAIRGEPKDPMEVDMEVALTVAHDILGIKPISPEDYAALERGDYGYNQLPIDVAHLITDLHDKQIRLSQYIESHQHDLDAMNLARLYAVYAQNATRIGRLLRDRYTLYHGAVLDELDDDVSPVVEEWLANLLATE